MKFSKPLIAGMLTLIACGGPAEAPPTTAATTTVASTAATTSAPTTTAPPETTASPSTTPAQTSLDFPDFAVPFTLGEQPGWSVADLVEDWAVSLTASEPRFLVVTSEGPGAAIGATEASVDLWVEHVNGDEFVEAVEVEETTVGGFPARVFDLRLLPGDERGSPCGRPCYVMFTRTFDPEGSGGYGWFLFDEAPNRAWFVDVNDKVVAVFAETNEDDFEAWMAEVEAALAELEWTG